MEKLDQKLSDLIDDIEHIIGTEDILLGSRVDLDLLEKVIADSEELIKEDSKNKKRDVNPPLISFGSF